MPKNQAFLDAQKEKANIGCDVCPNCGEVKKEYSLLGDSGRYVYKGITHDYDYWCKGIFNIKYLKIDIYQCNTCGCKWQSEPYEYK